ncbi:MAG TPA: amino acid adenylation domain-containing protein [Micromonosporaceae bacterium]
MGRRPLAPIHVAISQVAAAQPDQPAVLGVDGTELTYRQLDRAADGWCRRLRAQGVRPNTVVPVLMRRSPSLPVLLLAVLKCGAAYAVLDPRWPPARIDAVLAAIGRRHGDPAWLAAPLLVVGAEYQHLVTGAQVPVWTPPPLGEPDPDGDGGPAGVDVSPDAPACVFFTSGTTGESKGVVSPHRATTRLFTPDGPMAFGPGDVMPQTTMFSWDVASLELWGMLTTGGTCVVVEDDYLTPYRIAELVGRYKTTTLWLTTSLFNLTVTEDLDCFEGLRQIYIGGERLSPSHVRDFLDRYPDTRLHNGYGPVESCVFATTHLISTADCAAEHGIPIGRPVPGTEVVVLDGDEVCDPGTPGELCLAGDGLALGYLGDEALTRAKFTEVPVHGRPTRVYRTGDLGVRDESGVHHFLGRTDRQIKLRGQRIELDGIEAEANAVAPLTGCAVVALPGTLSQYDGIALFYTVAPGTAAASSGGDPLDVRRKLAGRLPPYAVPDLVTVLDQLPLNPNGKVDYAALRSAYGSRS